MSTKTTPATHTRPKSFRRALIFSLTALVSMTTPLVAAPSASAAPGQIDAPADMPGWTRDFVDDFKTPINTALWGRYESSTPPAGKLAEWDLANVNNIDGSMVIRTYNAGGIDWRSGGASSGRGFSATQGKWAIRAKFDRAQGVSYAFLLYPQGGGWPPEIDIAEGTAGSNSIMSTFHWSPSNLRDSRFKTGVDMTKWHTYGVILSDNKIQFTIDGGVWTTINNSASPRVPMWLGMQTGVKACPTDIGECVGPATPTDSNVYIDWVAHWSAS